MISFNNIQKYRENLTAAMLSDYTSIIEDDFLNVSLAYLHTYGELPVSIFKLARKGEDGELIIDGGLLENRKDADKDVIEVEGDDDIDDSDDSNGVYMSNLAEGKHKFAFKDTLANIGKENYIILSETIAVVPADDVMFSISMTAYRDDNVHLISLVKVIADSKEKAEEALEWFKEKVVEVPYKTKPTDAEYHVAYESRNGIALAKFTFKKVAMDIDKNYNDDIPIEKMNKLIETDKRALILLYGAAGTGKSTLIKHFIEEHKDKKFIYMDTKLVTNISDSSFLRFLMDQRHSIVILEDCERMLVSRNEHNPMMSTLLNLTDGILGDSFGVKFICTFNTPLNKIDTALLRKGRLSLKYEFKKLSLSKTKLHLPDAKEPMTLADIYNVDDENDFSKKFSKLGFHE